MKYLFDLLLFLFLILIRKYYAKFILDFLPLIAMFVATGMLVLFMVPPWSDLARWANRTITPTFLFALSVPLFFIKDDKDFFFKDDKKKK